MSLLGVCGALEDFESPSSPFLCNIVLFSSELEFHSLVRKITDPAKAMLTVSAMKMPHLISREGSKQLVVDGQPFLVLGGELQNSSLTSSEYMDSVWQRMVDMNVNTLLGAVTWEMVEPVENKFVFDELDKVILGARKHALRLVLLWFGSFKNGGYLSIFPWFF